jgi:hypothetical protein
MRAHPHPPASTLLASAGRVGLLLLVVTGCRQPPVVHYTDQYTATAAACGWGPRPLEIADLGIQGDAPILPSDACVDRIVADFNVDVEAFLEADDLPDVYAAAWGSDYAFVSLTGNFYKGVNGIGVFDRGTVDELEPGPLVSDQFVLDMRQVAEATDQQRVTGALYNYITSVVEDTRPGSNERFKASFTSGTRTLRIHPAGIAMMSGGSGLYAHEVRHLWRGRHIRCSWISEGLCDETIDDPIGYSVASKFLAWKHTVYTEGWGEGTQNSLRGGALNDLSRIAAFWDEDGELLPEWRDPDMSEW